MLTFVLGIFVGALGMFFVLKNNRRMADQAWKDADNAYKLAQALLDAAKKKVNL